jgi:hypothetical protein
MNGVRRGNEVCLKLCMLYRRGIKLRREMLSMIV